MTARTPNVAWLVIAATLLFAALGLGLRAAQADAHTASCGVNALGGRVLCHDSIYGLPATHWVQSYSGSRHPYYYYEVAPGGATWITGTWVNDLVWAFPKHWDGSKISVDNCAYAGTGCPTSSGSGTGYYYAGHY